MLGSNQTANPNLDKSRRNLTDLKSPLSRAHFDIQSLVTLRGSLNGVEIDAQMVDLKPFSEICLLSLASNNAATTLSTSMSPHFAGLARLSPYALGGIVDLWCNYY
jgi:hypothetical protein